MRPGFDQEGDPDLTDLPVFNDLTREIQRYLEGSAGPTRARDLLARVDQVLGRMHEVFLEGLPFREDTVVSREVVPEVSGAFGWLQQSVRGLYEAFDRHDSGAVRELQEEARDAVQTVCRGLARLQAEDEAQERFSEIWAIHEICRVGRAWMRGRLPEESFRRRLETFEGGHRVLREWLEALEPSPREETVLAVERPRLENALDRQEEALQVIQAALELADEEPILPALEQIRQAGVEILLVQQALHEAATREEERPCPRCGASNPISARFCAGCQGGLPRLAADADLEISRLDLVAAEETISPQYPNLVRLAEAVEGYRAGSVSEWELGALLDEMETLLAATWQQFTHMEPLPAQTPPEYHDVYQAARRAFEEGQLRLGEGLRAIRAGMRDLAGPGLEQGLAMAQSASGPMQEFERFYLETRPD